MKEYYKKTTRRIPSAILPPHTERFSGVRIASGLILILLAVAVFAGSGAAADATNTSITNWAQLNDNITNWNSVGDTDLLTIIIPEGFISDDAAGKVNIDVSGRVLIKPAIVDSNEIKLDAKQQGRLFTINSGGNLTLTGNGTTVLNLTGGQVTGDNGGGIYIYSGNLTLQANANITGCKALGVSQNGGIGGGVYVGEDGTFTMSSGNITGCTSSTYIYFFSGGGGVYNRGTFTMSGGSITGCTSILNSFGGGGVYNRGTFTMSGGSITGCTANSFGGGVYVGEDGTFTMSGGSITNCTAYSGGGVYVNNNNGTFTMSGGSITDCKATSYRSRGGGVINLGTFTMSGGSITGCTADTGGGVYVGVDGTFTMSGGSINDCSASRGSGVSINYYFRETGGKYIDCFGTFVMNGTAVVANEVYLMANTTDYHFCTQITLGTNGFSSPDAGAKKITLEGNVANLLGKTIVKGGAKNASCFALNSSITGYGLLAKSGEDLVLEAAAKIDETGIAYSTVEYAFSNVTAGQTVKLLKDSTLTTEIIIDGMNKSATLDLNGFTLTANKDTRLFKITSGQSFNLTDKSASKKGALKGNGTVSGGGGGVLVSDGTFNMTGGSITGCEANSGGGVYVDNGMFNMYGGSITGCKATLGGGVWVKEGKFFNVTGSAQVTGNIDSTGKSNNGFLSTTISLNLTGPFTGSIGIKYAGANPAAGLKFGNVTAGASGAEKFFSDDGKFIGSISGSDLVWKAKSTPTPQPKPTQRQYSGGGSSSNTGSGNYNYYPRQADGQAETISFGTSKTVKAVELPAGVTGEVTLVAKSSVPAPSSHNTYNVFEINIPNYPTGKEAVIDFVVPLSTLAKEGKTPADVSLLHGDGTNWDAATLPTTFTVDGDNAVYHSTTTSFSPFAIVYVDGAATAETPEAAAAVVAAATSAPAAQPTVVVAAEKTVVTVATAEPTATATQAAASPMGLSAVLAGLAAGCVLVLRRRE